MWTNAACCWGKDAIIKAMSKGGNILVIVLLVVVIAVIIGFVVWSLTAQKNAAPATTASSSTYTYLSDVQTPTGIPNGLPIDTKPEILQNFQTNYPSAQQQEAVFEYVTAKTVAQAFADYKAFIQKNGWTLVSSDNEGGVASISAQTQFTIMDVTMGTNSALGQNTVTITTSYYAPSAAPLSTTTSVSPRK